MAKRRVETLMTGLEGACVADFDIENIVVAVFRVRMVSLLRSMPE